MSLHMLNKLWVEKRESGKLVLVQVHHEHLVRGGQVGLLRRELPVKVADIFAVTLKIWMKYKADFLAN